MLGMLIATLSFSEKNWSDWKGSNLSEIVQTAYYNINRHSAQSVKQDDVQPNENSVKLETDFPETNNNATEPNSTILQKKTNELVYWFAIFFFCFRS